nr:MAG TPA: hypothetical protein [Caudoviricetes sp.]
MSDGIHIPGGTAGEKPGRTLRNLGEPWEPLRARRGAGGRRGAGQGGASKGREPVPIRSGTSTYRPRAAGRTEAAVADGKLGRDAGQLWGRWRNTAEKSDDVCRHNGLFVAIPTVRETWDGIRHAVYRVPRPYPLAGLGVAAVTQNGGIGVGTPCRCRSASCLPPSRRSRAAAARERRGRQVHDTVHPHRYGASAPLRSAARAPGR